MFRHALVPLDGSDLAECTLNHATTMIKDGILGEVTLFNVYKVDFPWIKIDDEFQHIDLGVLKEKAREVSQRYLTGLESRLASQGVRVTTVSWDAPKADAAIADYARTKDIDVVIMATHGYTGMKRMLMGSVASGVLNQSSVPVLLIRPESCRV